MKNFFILITFSLFCFSAGSNCLATTSHEEFVTALSDELKALAIAPEKLENSKPSLDDRNLCLALIYSKTGSRPLWVTEKGPDSKAAVILDFIKKSEDEGLNPQKYQVGEIENLWASTTPASLAHLDTLLTFNVVRYIYDASYGQLQLLSSDDSAPSSDVLEKNFDSVAATQDALNAPDLAAFLSALVPSHNHYQGLKHGLKIYRKIAASGGWKHIPEGKTLRPGDIDDRVPLIYKRMFAPGIPQPPKPEGNVYGPSLQAAVARFQQLNGIEPDGVIGPQTITAMNVTAQALVEQIIVNMARWRWQAHNLGKRYVLVNIASYNLTAYNGEDMVLNFPVIIGQLQHQTPVFSDSIKYIELNPFWNITPSIAKNEELPSLRKNPRHLVDRHVRLYSNWGQDATELDSTAMDWHAVTTSQMAGYKLRQDPGPWNSLGRIKFVFPNKYSVYMHDTPSRNLFARSKRDFSHGCIRLSNPMALALFALENQGKVWTKEMIQALYDSGKRKVLYLTHPLPIHITYQTSWVDKEEQIHFNRDIYARDEKLFKALQNGNDRIELNIEKTPVDLNDKINQ
jgi:murein L,D-transpeptidase YcbB/YkuD